MRRQNENGCSSVFTSRLNLVDLAGTSFSYPSQNPTPLQEVNVKKRQAQLAVDSKKPLELTNL